MTPEQERPRSEILSDIEKEVLGHWLETATWEIFPDVRILNKLESVPADSFLAVTAPPTRPPEDQLEFALRLRRQGRQVVPHIAARQFETSHQLQQHFERLKSAGVENIFVIAGDGKPKGNLNKSWDALFALSDSGIEFASVGVAGYPEGHPQMDRNQLTESLKLKQWYSEQTGTDMYLVTQMCFDADPIVAWIDQIRGQDIHLPVVVGVPGVVSLPRLATFAYRCGVGDSSRFLRSIKPGWTSRLFRATWGSYSPDSLLSQLAAQASSDQNIVGIRLYTFNAIKNTHDWLDQKIPRG
jgi:methylenetetrahydrofolate reductase (NADPH)